MVLAYLGIGYLVALVAIHYGHRWKTLLWVIEGEAGIRLCKIPSVTLGVGATLAWPILVVLTLVRWIIFRILVPGLTILFRV